MLEIVSGVNDTNGAGARAHDYRLGGRATGKKMNPLHVVAVRYYRRGHNHVARRLIFDRNLLVDIFDTHFFGPLNFSVVSRLKTALHITTDTAQRSSRQNSFRGSADAHQEIDTGLRLRGSDGGRHVTVADQADARAGFADFFDERFVARTIKNDDRQILDLALLRFGERVEVLCRCLVEIDDAF